MQLTYIEHACVAVEHNGTVVVVDPFFSDEKAVRAAYPSLFAPDYILLTHGHGDHIGSLPLVCTDKTVVVGLPELCSYLRKKGVRHTYDMNFGGTKTFGDLTVSFVPALHSSSADGVYLGPAAGVVFTLGDKTFYHMGDTDLFGDMAYIQKFFHPQIGFVPIGGRYTMNEDKAAFCCNEFFSFEKILPVHYNTFPGIEASAASFARKVTSEVLPLAPISAVVL